MNLNSLDYALFLIAVFFLFWLLRGRWRAVLLLAASLVFYGALREPALLLALGWVAIATYFTGLRIEASSSPRARLTWLWAGILFDLLGLFYFKYIPFLFGNINALLRALSMGGRLPALETAAALGVSFFSFQAISYLADIYLEMISAEKRPVRFALYLAFFPKLLQGPIERGEDLLPQLEFSSPFDAENIRRGLLLIGWGLFKKAVIADRIAIFVNAVYGNPSAYSGVPLILATYLYAAQLYCDFSGYTDMAIGSARLFGVRLSPNFRSPYWAASVADFWRRWHISFSRWLLDYLFKPLQMSFRGYRSAASPIALLVTFIICGIWHGASWTFIAWGLLHGIYMAFSIVSKNLRAKSIKALGLGQFPGFHRALQVAITFNLVCIGWVFFRANSMADAYYILSHALSGLKEALGQLYSPEWIARNVYLGQPPGDFWIVCIALAIWAVAAKRMEKKDWFALVFSQPVWLRWLIYYALVFSILILGQFGEVAFLYFRF